MLVGLVIISAGIAGAFLVSAYILWRTDGPFTDALCLMLISIATEIVVAIIADRYVEHDIELFAKIKMAGRILEAAGVAYFLWQLARQRR
jgi:hypothetical protein